MSRRGKGNVTELEKARMIKLRRDGLSCMEIALTLNRHVDTVRTILRGIPGISKRDKHGGNPTRPGYLTAYMEEFAPAPKVYVGDLSEEARDCLRDFELFCDRVFPDESLSGFQRDIARRVIMDPDVDFGMVLGPQRHGKSKVCAVFPSTWYLAGGGHPPEFYDDPENPLRDRQVLLVAKAEEQIKRVSNELAAKLTQNRRLIDLYGRFKGPETIWRESRGALMVDGRERDVLSGDYSLVTVGVLSAVMGRGAHYICVDDVADTKNCRGAKQAEELLVWLRAEVFSRAEPGAKVVVDGARLPVELDIYSLLEGLTTDELGDLDPDVADDAPKLFRTFIYPAIADWGERTVLAPERGWTFPRLLRKQAAVGRHVFETMWQQVPRPPGTALCRREWIWGESGFPGCLDRDRPLGTPRADVAKVAIRLLSIDPSPTQFAAAILLDIAPHKEYSPVLIDIHRGRMRSADMLRLFEDWFLTYSFSYLLIEKNAASYFLEDRQFIEWRKQTGVRVLEHTTTGSNKAHEAYGEQTLATDIEAGRIRIPYGDERARGKFNILIRELLEEVGTNDTRMSLWFPKANLSFLLSVRFAKSPGVWDVPPPITPPPDMLPYLPGDPILAPTEDAWVMASAGLP